MKAVVGSSRPFSATSGWAVLYLGRPYVPKLWPTREEAQAVLAELLRYHKADNPWRKRLRVGYCAGPKRYGKRARGDVSSAQTKKEGPK